MKDARISNVEVYLVERAVRETLPTPPAMWRPSGMQLRW